MILDYMKNYRMYNSLVSNLEEGMTFVNTLLDKPEGRYEAEHGIYAMVQIGVTSDIGKDRMESHEKYLDVQYLVSGKERLGFTKNTGDYQIAEHIKERDLIFYQSVEDEGWIESRPGCFCIFFPSDIHRPECISGESMKLRKVVVKVSAALL